ncbi:hypothetical protein L9F63_021557 [Diploptera punctata]|uniref:Uncharacterized protein n=1 Tax=Diploptera punctata TaxID=6984 RepID=A0AAD7ZP42_DIPPU|nr:hypothetical protein L9F63_021557 [Diploptera punctata]
MAFSRNALVLLVVLATLVVTWAAPAEKEALEAPKPVQPKETLKTANSYGYGYGYGYYPYYGGWGGYGGYGGWGGYGWPYYGYGYGHGYGGYHPYYSSYWW